MGYATAVANTVFLATAYACQKLLLERIPPVWVNATTMAVVVVLALLTLALHRPPDLLRALRSRLPYLLALGAIASGLFLCLLYGLRLSSLTSAALLTRLDVLFVAVLGAVFLREKLRLRDGAGVLLMLVGALLVVRVSWAGLSVGGRGDLFLVLSALLLSVNAIIIRGRLTGLPNEAIAGANASVQSIICSLIAVLLRPADIGVREVVAPGTIELVLGAGTANFLAFWFYYATMKRMPAWQARTFSLLVPLWALVADMLVFGDVLSLRQFIGMGILFGGAAILIAGRRRNRTP